jgi:hypothetical protein
LVKSFKLVKTRAGDKSRLVFPAARLSIWLQRDAEAFSVALGRLKIDLAALGRSVFIDPDNQEAFDNAVKANASGTWVSRFNSLDGQMHKVKTCFVDGFLKGGSLDDFEASFETVARFFAMLDREIELSTATDRRPS